jgi:hypothetical protein
MTVMNSDVRDPSETREDVLSFDVPDDDLERAAGAAEGQAITLGFCTHWYYCRWPM